MIVDIFIPCQIDQFHPSTAHSMIKVLERLSCGVNYNIEQTCCGKAAFEDGYWDHTKEVGEKLIKEFQNERYVVCPGASCTATIKCQYPSIFHNSSMHNEYKLLQKHMYEFSDFLVNVMHASDIGARYEAKAVFMDACKAVHELGIKEAPRVLLSKVRGLEMVEVQGGLPCCGISGGLERKNEELAVQMGMQLLKSVMDAGASVIISTDIECLLHLDGIIKKQKLPLKVEHIADVLASGWE
ncbi:MAG TPA: (Fe-S)-binding protein [Bacteroidia bacterium]|nr:(Fe-S)-binding protein [Bacteroidia bacterium]